MVTVGVYVGIVAAALAADALALDVPLDDPETVGTLIDGTLGTVTDGTDDFETVGAEMAGAEIVGILGNFGTAL